MSRRSVPFVDLPAMMEVHGEKLERALTEVVRSGVFIHGPKVAALEERLARRLKVRHAISCGSGTAAEQLLLMALDIGPGDEVLLPDFTFIATAEAVASVGATPVMVDVDPRTFTLDPDAVREAMGPKVKAIVPVSLFGHPAALDELESLADEYGVHCLEDACQSLGSSLNDRPSGSFGTASFTSFYPSKPLGGIGDGGMLFTDDDDLAAKLRLVREHGQVGRHEHTILGLNSRLDALQAAALLVKEECFGQEVEMRRARAHRYDEALAGTLQVPHQAPGAYSSYAQYTIRVVDEDARNGLIAHLHGLEIPTALHYPRPVHEQESLQSYLRRIPPSPVTSSLCQTVLSLPLSAYMSMHDQERVIEGVLDWARLGEDAAAASL